MELDKQRELINDVVTSERISNCCGAPVYAPTDDWAICMDCKEHCDAISEEVETEWANKTHSMPIHEYPSDEEQGIGKESNETR